MALSGTFFGTTDNGNITPRIDWWAVQSVEGNYSDVTATLSYSRTNTGYTTEGNWAGSLTIGSETGSATGHLQIGYNSQTAAITYTARIYHSGDGTCALTISATGGISGTSLGNTYISGYITLDTIPRATTIAAGKADVGGALMIALDRKHSDFTHSIQFHFGSIWGYVGENGVAVQEEVKLQNATPWFYLPADFYTQMPYARELEGTLYCRTYSGDTQIGTTQQTTFTAVAAKEVCSPYLYWDIADVNPDTLALTGDNKVLIKGCSIARCGIAAYSQYSAVLTEVAINGVSRTLDGNHYAFLDIVPEVNQVNFFVKDSREYSSEVVGTSRWIDYIPLTCHVEAKRTDPVSGKAQLTIWGKFYNDTFPLAENALQLSYRISGGEWVVLNPQISGNDYITTIPLEGLDYRNRYPVEVVAQDRLITLSEMTTIEKGTPVFDWGENSFRFHVPVYLQSGEEMSGFQSGYLNTDVDGAHSSGSYRVAAGVPNFPVANGGVLLVFGNPGSCTMQFAADYSGSDIWVRTNWYGTWYPWKKVSLA